MCGLFDPKVNRYTYKIGEKFGLIFVFVLGFKGVLNIHLQIRIKSILLLMSNDEGLVSC